MPFMPQVVGIGEETKDTFYCSNFQATMDGGKMTSPLASVG